MNYILSQLNRRINFLASDGQKQELKIVYQAKFEFILVFYLGYLWNRNWDKIEENDREYIINCILKPSIGTIVSIVRRLDVENELFGRKRLKDLYEGLDKYPKFRNEMIGHGFSFGDNTDEFLSFFESVFDILDNTPNLALNKPHDIIKVYKVEAEYYRGISYKPDGSTYISWTCPISTFDFQLNNTYILTDTNEYIRISPFIKIDTETQFYTFCSVEEKLTGRTKYNQLLVTGTTTEEITEFEKMTISSDKFKRKSANGTIINIFENNYKRYIDVGIIDSITKFLLENKSSVFATIWGHGGVGKTASIQRACEILSNQERKVFDYIIFLSAKDRYYNFYKGRIHLLHESITTLGEIVSTINSIIFNDESLDISQLVNYTGKVLIVIDDLETFNKNERDNIIEFTRKLNINHHKVILTTRAATLVTGEEIATKELNEENSIKFFRHALQIEVPGLDLRMINKELGSADIRKKVFQVTSGRPLFILQLAIFVGQKGNLHEALNHTINSTKDAIDFLYDRLYDYLSLDAKNMFLAVSLLANDSDLTGLIDNLKFILNKEDKEEEFEKSLNELIKLKILILLDKGIFKIYSIDILQLMKKYYQEKGPEYDAQITNRYTLINEQKGIGTERALLDAADASRFTLKESEVEGKYRYILNRNKTPNDIKLKALLNLAHYLGNTKGKGIKAIKLFSDYEHLFKRDTLYVKSFAIYCWAEGSIENRNKAVVVIREFLGLRMSMPDDTYLDLLGHLATYEGILVVNERDEIKLKLKNKEITDQDHSLYYNDQKRRIRELCNFPCGKLYDLVKSQNLMNLNPAVRSSVLDGLTNYVELLIRNQKWELAKEVCNKIIREMPADYHHAFVYKRNKIELIENPGNKSNSDLTNLSGTSLLAERLKEALSKKNEI